MNRLFVDDIAIHNWYRFVLAFPPHLVREYLKKFSLRPGQTVLDPFCGTGTTLLEAKLQGIESIGIEPNPVVHFAAEIKTSWPISEHDMEQLKGEVERVVSKSSALLKSLSDDELIERYHLSDSEENLLITGSITPIILSKSLLLLENISEQQNPVVRNFMRLVFAKHLVHSFSNLKFGPEVGVSRNKLIDCPVIDIWYKGMEVLIADLSNTPANSGNSRVILGDSRHDLAKLEDYSIDAVITSPPYPNEKDYSRTTRLESVVLGFMSDKVDLRSQKMMMLSSNTKTVYAVDKDYELVEKNALVSDLAWEIEARRIELGKNSGFEKLYSKVIKLYFGGMKRHLSELRMKLKPSANLAYVVGDQASYFQIPIRTGEILAEIASDLGYEVKSIDIFRTRFSTTTQENLNEEVVWLQAPVGGFTVAEDKISASSEEINVDIEVKKGNRYSRILEHIFFSKYAEGDSEVTFTRIEIEEAAQANSIDLPKNLGDVIYSFKYRTPLPPSIVSKSPAGSEWAIVNKGTSKYAFVARKFSRILPDLSRHARKIPDQTPSIVAKYTSVDEQALLTKLRYNRILDLFTGVVCSSLQNHLRTTVIGIGQVETDEIYVGVDKDGRQYVFPVQAKGGKDELGVVQIEQDIALCKQKFPDLVCRAIAAQFLNKNTIAMFEFADVDGEVRKIAERHYELVDASQIDASLLKQYAEIGDTE